MIEGRIRPGRRSVTVLAGIGCLQMIRRFTRSARSIVTAETTARNTRMIEGRVRPCGRRVTVLAGIRRLQMIGRLAGRRRPVMTTEAGPHY